MTDERRLHSVAPLKADPTELARLRALADESLHTYIVAAAGYDLQRAMVVFNRVKTTLDNQLHPSGGEAA